MGPSLYLTADFEIESNTFIYPAEPTHTWSKIKAASTLHTTPFFLFIENLGVL